MLISKGPITIFSSIVASSIPVISVASLKFFKSSSLGNEIEGISKMSSEEGIIAFPELIKPKVVIPEVPTIQETTIAKPEVPAVVHKVEQQVKQEVEKESPSTTIPNQQNIVAEEIKEVSAESATDKLKKLEATIKKLFEQMLQQKTNSQNNNNNSLQNINSFIEILKTKQSITSDETEKSKVTNIINALTKLETKINSSN